MVKWRRYIFDKKLVCLNFPVPIQWPLSSSFGKDRVIQFVLRELRDVIMTSGNYETWVGEWVMRVFKDGVGRRQVVEEIAKIVGSDAEVFVENVLVFVGSQLGVSTFDKDSRWGERQPLGL